MDAALPFAVATAMFAITMVFAGRMQDIFGPRRVAVSGGLIFGLGLALSSLTTTPWVMVLTFGVGVGAGIGLANAATTPAAVKWFPPSRKGLVSGVVVGGVGIAAIIMAPLSQALLDNTDIPTTFLTLGIGSAAAIILLAQLLQNPPAGYRPAQTARTAHSPAAMTSHAPDVEWRDMLRTRRFYIIWVIYALGTASGLMLISNVAVIAHEQAAWQSGFIAVMTLAVFNTIGRFGSGAISDRIGRSATMIIALILQAINMLAFSYYTTPATLLAGCALVGICYGSLFPLLPAATADFYGLKNLGVNYGLVFTAFGVAGLSGSLLGGRVRDMFGSYSIAYIICAGMLIVAAILAFYIKPPKKEDSKQ
jgi:OFA family oxalate/formate antiporter-like MFS transporter